MQHAILFTSCSSLHYNSHIFQFLNNYGIPEYYIIPPLKGFCPQNHVEKAGDDTFLVSHSQTFRLTPQP